MYPVYPVYPVYPALVLNIDILLCSLGTQTTDCRKLSTACVHNLFRSGWRAFTDNTGYQGRDGESTASTSHYPSYLKKNYINKYVDEV